jgi:L,D-transpeptidase catalytic domain
MINRSVSSFLVFLSAAVAAAVLLVPAALGDTSPVTWTAPTPSDGTHYNVTLGKSVSFVLNATADLTSIVHISATKAFPAGVKFNSSDGVTAHATFTWLPEKPGDYTVKFSASVVGGTVVAPTVTYSIHVRSKVVKYPLSTRLSNATIANWAPVAEKTIARSKPTNASRAVTTLDTRTTDSDTQNLVLILRSMQKSAHETWYRVRLPMLPNNTAGWVRSTALGDLYKVNTHLYVDRAHFRATLKRNGKVIFTARVGVGRTIWPTPRGEFYIRSKLTNFNDPFYGPVAFGTSARSNTLTDWPGGGFVGVHGTNEPGILPGRVSHGCIRMRNPDILKLAKLMPVGTPLTIT